jgi:hypothetical protein
MLTAMFKWWIELPVFGITDHSLHNWTFNFFPFQKDPFFAGNLFAAGPEMVTHLLHTFLHKSTRRSDFSLPPGSAHYSQTNFVSIPNASFLWPQKNYN